MKLIRFILASTAFVLTSTGLMAQGTGIYAGSIPNCIARWTFDNSAGFIIDSSGNNNNGILSNTLSVAGWRNIPAQSAKFNAINSGGLVPHSTSLSPQNGMTIIGLIKFDSFNIASCQGSNILSKGPDNGIGCYSLRSSDNVYDGSCTIASPDKNALECAYYTDNGGHAPHPFIQSGKWYFTATKFDPATSRKYVYQIEMDENNYASPLVTVCNELITPAITLGSNTNDVSLGYAVYNNDPHKFRFNGLMDELALFDRPLTEKEIMDAYTFLWNKGLNTTGNKEVNVLKNEIQYYVKEGQLHLTGLSNEQYNVMITDMLGRNITQLTMKTGLTTVDLSQLAQQVFVVNVYNQKGRYAFKVTN